ncbi:MAG: cupin [Elusimicrobia bacterium RIFOXYD12_FULL_66_9]|nr:MAG: cupin [Elusimicrobia bacterium RIFOXYD12_FULL_66_9]
MSDQPDDLHGKSLDTAALVSYEAGAVVSRTLIKRPGGTVTLFSFDKGSELSEHTAPFDALVTVLEGEAEVTVAGRAHRVEAGRSIIMPGGKPHALKAVERFKMMLVMIRA